MDHADLLTFGAISSVVVMHVNVFDLRGLSFACTTTIAALFSKDIGIGRIGVPVICVRMERSNETFSDSLDAVIYLSAQVLITTVAIFLGCHATSETIRNTRHTIVERRVNWQPAKLKSLFAFNNASPLVWRRLQLILHCTYRAIWLNILQCKCIGTVTRLVSTDVISERSAHI